MTRSPTGGPDLFATSIAVIAAGQSETGAFVAGPTFSQYGYSWFRDGAFIAESLDHVGQLERSARFHHWVARVILASADGLQRARTAARAGYVPDAADYLHCRYDVDGVPADAEWPAFQLDGPGIWLWALRHHLEAGGELDDELRRAVGEAARYLTDLWVVPCSDAWEEFDEHVHSTTLAAIRVGLEAARAMAPELDADAAVSEASDAIEARLSVVDGAFTKWSGSDAVDASMLWIAAPYEWLAPTEPRFAATLERIETELVTSDVAVHRYRDDTYYGGGAWPLLTSAYARVLLRRGEPEDLERARRALRWIVDQADADGYLPEQVADEALAPERIDEWRAAWGESARPLLWSHAAYLSLHTELAALGESPSDHE